MEDTSPDKPEAYQKPRLGESPGGFWYGIEEAFDYWWASFIIREVKERTGKCIQKKK